MTSKLPPVHPGEILREEYLIPLGMSAGALAKHLNVPRTRIERLATEQTAITPDTALRLAKFFRTTPEFWMNMQASYDLAAEAEAKYRRHHVDAVIADYGLPRTTGWELYQSLRKLRPDLLMIIAGGDLSRERLAALRQGGVTGTVRKPYDIREVLRTLRRALDRK